MGYNIEESKINEQYRYMSEVRTLTGLDGGTKYAYIQTFGCQQNEADSERLAGMLETMGYAITGDEKTADVIMVNTCAVREHAELKALSITGQYKHLKELRPTLLIGMCGCMASQEKRLEDVKKRYPYVDFLFGTAFLYRFPEILYTALTTGKRAFYLDDSDGNIAEGLPVKRESGFKAWVSIMYGCDNFCTYCVVPYVRGRERSRKPEEILSEVRSLAGAGYREITLLGQNVNSYGKDLGSGYDFSALLEDICRIDGNFIVRFMTSHPKDASRKLIDTMAANEKIAKAFHLPLQSGSNRVLEAMNRRYTRESYLGLVSYMRERMPDIALSTDIIVGFPTETEAEFEETLDMLRRVRYDSIYSFIFSKRDGTKAAEMDGQISDEVKGERFKRLLDTQNAISLEKNREYEGRIIEALVEGRSKTDDRRVTGRNEKGRLVHFEADDSVIGKIALVKVTRAETYPLYGEFEGLKDENN